MLSMNLGEESKHNPKLNGVLDPNTNIHLYANRIQDSPKRIGG